MAASSTGDELLHLPPSWPTQTNENCAVLPKTTHALEFLLLENTNRENQFIPKNNADFFFLKKL